jgi:hypothetical protein
MPYVMIPVPEEHVEDVMQFVLRAIARGRIEPWTTESIAEVYEEVDEASRSLLAFVARAMLEGAELTNVEAAQKIQLSLRETNGILSEMAREARDDNRPSLIGSRTVTERLPNGRTTEKRLLQMDFDVAEMVRDAEQAELRELGAPLAEGAE